MHSFHEAKLEKLFYYKQNSWKEEKSRWDALSETKEKKKSKSRILPGKKEYVSVKDAATLFFLILVMI